MKGTYVQGSGKPPWGVTTLEYFFYVDWLPTLVSDWYISTAKTIFQTTRYIYNYRVIIKDAGGRTDSFNFTVNSLLLLEED